jgi:hypothetical protein
MSTSSGRPAGSYNLLCITALDTTAYTRPTPTPDLTHKPNTNTTPSKIFTTHRQPTTSDARQTALNGCFSSPC